jgi:hypothetical protein
MKFDAAFPWIVRSLVVAALLAIGAWVASRTHWEEMTVPLPLRGEALTNPQYAQKVFLQSLGLKVETRKVLGSMPPRNGVMFVSTWHWDLIEPRRRALEEWVQQGGRLVVDTSLIDSLNTFAEFSGITQEYPEYDEDEEEEAGESESESESATGEGTEGESQTPFEVPDVAKETICAEWEVTIDLHGASGSRKLYSFCPVVTFGWLTSATKPVWAVSDSNGYQAMRVPVGNGSVTSINAAVFDNREFTEVSRGALFVAAGELRRGDTVWLLTESDYPSLLTLVWRYGAPVVCLFGLFVVAALWRNAIRFGPLRAPPLAVRRSLAEQIRGTGWFILRLSGSRTLYNAMVRSTKEEAARRIPRYANLTLQQQLDALVARTGLDRDDLHQALFVANGTLSRQHLYKAIGLLETVRRLLAQEAPAHLQSQSFSQSSSEASPLTQKATYAD